MRGGYVRRLGLFSGTMAVVGGVIGSGIFLNPSIVAQRAPTAALTIGTWALGGLIALLGAFCYAELGGRRPRAGGGYVYLAESFGPLAGFLYGWALLLVVATGAIAAVAVTFARYAGALAGLPPSAVVPLAVGAIALLTAINIRGVAPGAVTQNVFTVLKLAALALLIVAGLTAPVGPDALAPAAAPPEPARLPLVVGVALVPILFAYGGWQQANFIAEEIRDVERTLPRALVLGTAIVVLVYVLANIAYVRMLGVGGLAASAAPAGDVMAAAHGPWGRRVINAGIACSTFGFLNLVILVSPRVYQAMAADGSFLPALARLHPRFRTPVLALVLQGVWAVVLALSGSYGQLLDYVVFGDWIFFGLTAATVVVYRRRAADDGYAGFRLPFYPLTPIVFVAAAAAVVASSVISNPRNALIGTALIAAGIPVFLARRAGRPSTGP